MGSTKAHHHSQLNSILFQGASSFKILGKERERASISNQSKNLNIQFFITIASQVIMYQYILDYMGQGRLVFTPILHQKMFWQISVWYFPSMELMPREDKLVWTVSYILFHPPNNPLVRISAAYLGGVVGANVALSVVGQCVVGSGLHWVLCSVGQCIVCSGSGPVYSGRCSGKWCVVSERLKLLRVTRVWESLTSLGVLAPQF